MIPLLQGAVQAVDVVSDETLCISEFFGSSSSGDSQLSACVVIISEACGEASQQPEFDEYVMVLAGEVLLVRRGERGLVQKGEGVLLKAGEPVVWVWEQPCQYVTICLLAAGRSCELANKAAASSPVKNGGDRLDPLTLCEELQPKVSSSLSRRSTRASDASSNSDEAWRADCQLLVVELDVLVADALECASNLDTAGAMEAALDPGHLFEQLPDEVGLPPWLEEERYAPLECSTPEEKHEPDLGADELPADVHLRCSFLR